VQEELRDWLILQLVIFKLWEAIIRRKINWELSLIKIKIIWDILGNFILSSNVLIIRRGYYYYTYNISKYY
jgi:hypothetical protein